MISTNIKRGSGRFPIMVPTDCKDDIEFIISQTGIKSKGELIKLLTNRYRDDFINAYNQFFSPTNTQLQTIDVEPKTIVETSNEVNKPVTGAMDF